MSSEPTGTGAARPTLLVFSDSLSYYGPTGGLPSDDPRIWPNIVAAQLGWDVELIGRIGWTCRDVWWAATQDPRSWAALPTGGRGDVRDGRHGFAAVAAADGGARTHPLRPATGLRRWVRDGYGWLQPGPRVVSRPALPPHLTAEYLEMTRAAIDFNRPGIPLVASLPSRAHRRHLRPGAPWPGRHRRGHHRVGRGTRRTAGRPESRCRRRGLLRPRQSRTASTGTSPRTRPSPSRCSKRSPKPASRHRGAGG